MKDGKNLYEAEKAKRETFGKLFSKYELTVCVLYLSAELHVNIDKKHRGPGASVK